MPAECADDARANVPKVHRLACRGRLQKWGEPPAGTGRWQPMDRLCLTLVCGGIVMLVTALSLTAPEGSPRDRADIAILLNGVQR
jgi:hypothetical protein